MKESKRLRFEIQLESIEMICLWLRFASEWLNGIGCFEGVDNSDMKCLSISFE